MSTSPHRRSSLGPRRPEPSPARRARRAGAAHGAARCGAAVRHHGAGHWLWSSRDGGGGAELDELDVFEK